MSLFNALTDEQLLQRIRDDDELAFNELYRRHWTSLYDAACKRLGDSQEVEDIIQEVFLKLWIRRKELHIDNIAAYLHTAVRYHVFSYFTRRKTTSDFYEPFSRMLKEAGTPDQFLMAKELLELVYAYAETLSERKKQILLLYIKNKLSTKEIAETLGITQKTVQNQLGSALQALRKSLTFFIMFVLATFF